MGFVVELGLPKLSSVNTGISTHYLNVMFVGNVPTEPRTRILTSTYIRLTETALQQYESGRALIEEVWRGDRRAVHVGAFNSASGYFEACVTNMHRATNCMIAIKGRHYIQADVKQLLPKPIRFIDGRVAGRLRAMRDAVHHFEKEIQAGSSLLVDSKAFFLVANGPVTKRGNDDVKLIDRLEIGDLEIKFSDLGQWLREMAQCAEKICNYRRPSDISTSSDMLRKSP